MKPATIDARPDPGVIQFLRELDHRDGTARCYLHRHLWPAEDAGFIESQIVPAAPLKGRTGPIRRWCYRVWLIDRGRALLTAEDGDHPAGDC